MTAEPLSTTRPERHTALDALRALVVVGLVFFHSSLVFDSGSDFYVKNADTTGVTTIFAGLAVVWAMPALFLIAGLGAWHSLARRGPGRFALERLQRLGVPLVFALVTLLPVPQWLRLRAQPGYAESYLEFLPRFFQVRVEWGRFPFVLQGESFETGHLWFVLLLLTFALLLAPLARWVPAARARAVCSRLAAVAERRRGAILVPALLPALSSALLGIEQEYGGWHHWTYLLFFGLGFVIAADERFRHAMRRDAKLAVAAGLASFLLGSPAFLLAGDQIFQATTPFAIGARILYGVAGWSWVVAIMGLVDRPRTATTPAGRGNRFSAYLAPAVLPLYVLHQPIVVAVAFFVVSWHLPLAVKLAIVILASLVLTFAVYDLVIRRTAVTRYLFGMRS
ncbi:acyltransferase family protein [Nonomuraea typhae]|uniref:acyltransferase family protein n=1 Tax=Nonomuraea typhae TaxID=2603600 RepID=UPI0012FB7CE6|nr:acyltransferase family protein [Nonomuraea typhae]